MRQRLRRIVRRLRREEGGFTLVELVSSMAILMTVMGGLTALMVSGTKAEIDMNQRFQAQTQARMALERLRSEVHCAHTATAASPAAAVTLSLAATCPTSGGTAIPVTWCTTLHSAGRYELWRYPNSTSCSGSGLKVGDYLTTADAFTYTPPTGSSAAGTGQLAFLAVTLDVNLTPSKPEKVYRLDDRLVLRNSTRPA